MNWCGILVPFLSIIFLMLLRICLVNSPMKHYYFADRRSNLRCLLRRLPNKMLNQSCDHNRSANNWMFSKCTRAYLANVFCNHQLEARHRILLIQCFLFIGGMQRKFFYHGWKLPCSFRLRLSVPSLSGYRIHRVPWAHKLFCVFVWLKLILMFSVDRSMFQRCQIGKWNIWRAELGPNRINTSFWRTIPASL